MRKYRLGAHTKSDLKVHVVWIPKYRKAVLTGEVAIRVRDIIRQIAVEHELSIISGKVARDHVHVFFVASAESTRQSNRAAAQRHQLPGPPSGVPASYRRKFWGRHFWARGYLAVSSGTITDEMIKEYLDEQEGEQIADDSQFPIDSL